MCDVSALRSPKWILAAVVVIGGLAPTVNAAPFISGDLVVSRVGDGSAALAGTATAVFLDEYTPTGTLVQSIALPTTSAGGNFALTTAGTSTSETQLQLSPDKSTLSLIGFNAAPGGAVTSAVAGTVNRTIGTVNASGVANTSTLINTGSTGLVRSAITDGTTAWFSTDAHSIMSFTLGTTGAATQNGTTIVNTRVVGIFGGQLYFSSGAGSAFGVASLGTGEQTTTGQTETLLPGFPTTTGPSPYDFVFSDPNTLYVADDDTGTFGGVEKWTLSAGTWTNVYTIQPAGVGFRGLTGVSTPGGELLYATGIYNHLYSVLDTGTLGGAVITSLATGATNTALRGVDFAPVAPIPEPASLSLLALGTAALLTRRRR